MIKASALGYVSAGEGSYKVGQEITIVVFISSPDNYNGYDLNINFINLIYQSSALNTSNWFSFTSPTVNSSTISHSAVSQIFGGSYTGAKEIMTIKFIAPSIPATASIQISGGYFLFDTPGVPVQINSSTTTFKITKDKFPGDVNDDGKVNLSDLGILAQHWNKISDQGDLNNDGKVDLSDLSILAQNWGKSM